MRRALLLGTATVVLALAAPALADVTICDRVLRVSEKDIAYNGGLEPTVERAYRSDSGHTGVFGPGWGSRYDTRLQPQADGTVKISEYGCGPEVVFRTSADGSKLIGYHCGHQELTRDGDTWRRSYENGKADTFDGRGYLVRSADGNNNWIDIRRRADGGIVSVLDNFGRRLEFLYDDKGRLSRVVGDDGRQFSYEFDAGGRLARAIGDDGKAEAYGYDAGGHLTTITHADGSTETVAYDPAAPTVVTRYVDRSGTSHGYEVVEASNYREIRETTTDSDGSVLSRSRRSLFYHDGDSGHPWRELSDRDGYLRDTEYNQLGLPAIIRGGDGGVATFRYTAEARLARKVTNDASISLSYDRATGKVTRVEHRTPGAAATWSEYRYDSRGNLIAATSSDGHRVGLSYDTYGRVAKFMEGTRRMRFSYDRDSHPVVMEVAGSGKITVTYDRHGEIADVKSDGGRKIALTITRMFQDLLDIARAAKVNLDLS